jgi:hypothetical protein
MYFKPNAKLGPRFVRGKTEGQRGQALVEFVIVFPLLVILFLFVALQAWYWWNQSSAAIAIHDGTAAAAHHTGSLTQGYEETLRALAAPLGGTARDYDGTYFIVELPPMRATMGAIHNSRVIELPYIGPELFTVEATSFQRKEQFYGGPPSYFE